MSACDNSSPRFTPKPAFLSSSAIPLASLIGLRRGACRYLLLPMTRAIRLARSSEGVVAELCARSRVAGSKAEQAPAKAPCSARRRLQVDPKRSSLTGARPASAPTDHGFIIAAMSGEYRMPGDEGEPCR